MKKYMIALICILFTTTTWSADWYVSQTTGNKKGPGTKDAPFKAIFDALKAARPGDVIHMAAGSYTGQLGASQITIEKPVAIIGGYAPDFSERSILKYQTLIQPKNEKNDTKGQSVITLKLPAGPGPAMVIDGLVIDQGFMNSYHAIKGKPEGVETGMWLEPPNLGANDKFASGNVYSIYSETQGRFEGDIVIQNCVIANSGNYGLNLSHYRGNVKIINNLFVANRMEACEISCSNRNPGSVSCEFAYNTVLFTWSRTAEFTDMGYGFRCMTGVVSNIHHNIFGMNVFAGIGNDKGDPKSKNIKLDNNLFVRNKNADVTAVMSPNIIKLKAGTDEFDDLADFPGMQSVEGNQALKNLNIFKDTVNRDYLKGFIGAIYSEEINEDLSSETFKVITTKVSMFCNRYPLADTFKLFGCCQGYGAQAIK